MDEVFADPQVQHLGMSALLPDGALHDVHVVNQPIKLSRTPNSMAQPTPEKGEHTDEILKEYGFGEKDIEEFHRGGVV
jgi:crotonobetainyl-CoA:carnitine CoA-transferase CaiB-like acyl-CoA transferase